MTEQDEIRRLKELIAKQQLQLAEKDEIIRKQNIRIENMTQALLHAKKKIFGRSSEMTAPMKGQMFLFESTAELAKKLLQEQHAVTVPAHKRKIVPRKAGIREEMLSVLPKEYEEYVIDDKEVCSVCGSDLTNVGKQYVLRWSSIFVTFTLKKIIDWNISFQTVSCIHLMNVDVYDCNSHIHNPACFHLTLDLFQTDSVA